MTWVTDKLQQRRERQNEVEKDRLLQAEAKIKLSLEWKPLGDVVPRDRDLAATAAKAATLWQKVQVHALSPSKPVEDDEQDEDEDINEGHVKDDDEEDEFVGWPTHVLGVVIQKVERLVCTDDAATTFKVTCEVCRAVNQEGYAVHRTQESIKREVTRQTTKCLRPTLGSLAALARTQEEESVVAHKVSLLLANDVPIDVISEVLDVDKKYLGRCLGEGLHRSSGLRTVQFDENMTFYLHDDGAHLEVKFHIYANKDNQDRHLGSFKHSLESLGPHGVHIPLMREETSTGVRITGHIQVWPLPKDNTEKEKMNSVISRVRVIQANGLRKADVTSLSDPYCIVKLGHTRKAKEVTRTIVIDDNLDPVWDHGPVTIDWKAEKVLKFEVWDKDLVGQGDLLGEVTLSKQECLKGIHTDLYLGDGNGTLRVEVDPARYVATSARDVDVASDPVKYTPPKPKPVLEVCIDSASNLRGANYIGGKSDPYVVCSLSEKKVCRTPVIFETCSPQWNFGPQLFVVDNEDKLQFEVRDKDMMGSKPLGKACLKREQFLSGFEGDLSLGYGNGTLKVSVNAVQQGATKQSFTLMLSIVRARGLRNTDTIGKSDPYVLCKVEGKLVFQTDVIWDNLDPEWNHHPEEVELARAQDLRLEVYDKDLMCQGDFLGTATLTRDMCEKGYEGPLSLGEGNGTLEVVVERVARDKSRKDPSEVSPLQFDNQSPHQGAVSSVTSPVARAVSALSLSLPVGGECSPGSTLGLIRDKIQEFVSPTSARHARSPASRARSSTNGTDG